MVTSANPVKSYTESTLLNKLESYQPLEKQEARIKGQEDTATKTVSPSWMPLRLLLFELRFLSWSSGFVNWQI